jgi:hypothetical protein
MAFNPNPEGSMHPRTRSDPLPQPRENAGHAVTALERRITELEQLATSQGRELRIQFERIAQLQAELDILRIRFIKS